MHAAEQVFDGAAVLGAAGDLDDAAPVGIAACQEAATELTTLAGQGLAPDQLAMVLDFVVRDREQRRADAETIELVTSGPEGPGIANRDTGVVLRGLFAQAESSVLVAGYAVYQGQRVFQALPVLAVIHLRVFKEAENEFADSVLDLGQGRDCRRMGGSTIL